MQISRLVCRYSCRYDMRLYYRYLIGYTAHLCYTDNVNNIYYCHIIGERSFFAKFYRPQYAVFRSEFGYFQLERRTQFMNAAWSIKLHGFSSYPQVGVPCIFILNVITKYRWFRIEIAVSEREFIIPEYTFFDDFLMLSPMSVHETTSNLSGPHFFFKVILTF